MRYVSLFMLCVSMCLLLVLGSGCPVVTPGIGSLLLLHPDSGELDFGTDLNELTLGVAFSFGSDMTNPIQVTAGAPWLLPGDCTSFGDDCRSTGPSDELEIPIQVDRSLLAYGLNEANLTVTSGTLPALVVPVRIIDTLKADFSASTQIPYVNAPVDFTDLSMVYPGGGSIISYDWDFGDGESSSSANPQHTYTAPGTYTVSLTVETATESDTVVKQDHINVRVVSLDVDFNATPRNIQERDSVQFTNLTDTGALGGISYTWNFGDGTMSHEEHPLHQYLESGLYTISLTVDTAFGATAETKVNYVLVTDRLAPAANFVMEPAQGTVGENIRFFDLSEAGSSPVTQWVWSFGDGGGSTAQNPVYAYNATGTFDVSLTVITVDGNDTITKQVEIAHKAQEVDFDVSHRVIRQGETLSSMNNSVAGSLPITGWEWDFGDGGSSTDEAPDYVYSAPGQYTVSLTAFSGSGDVTETKTDYIIVLEPGAPVIINEFVASNRNGLLDEDGQTSDWLELYNPTDDPVSLLGWALTDNDLIPDKWLLPDVSLEPAGFLVIFASGKDRSVLPGELHTNFKLDADGEYLALVQNPVGPVVAHAYAAREQRSDVSFGLVAMDMGLLEPEVYEFMEEPTPGAVNAYDSARGDEATPPGLSHIHGHYDTGFDLTLTGTEPGAEIYYTDDGSLPNQVDGMHYTAPIPVTENTVIRAIAYAPDHISSKVVTATYIIGASSLQKALPALCVVGDPEKDLWGPDGIMVVDGGYYDGDGRWQPFSDDDFNSFLAHGRDWERKISLEFFDPNGAPASPERIGFQQDCGIRVHGSSWRRQQYRLAATMDDPWDIYQYKKSFRYYFRDEYGDARLPYPLIPNANLASFKHIVMRAGTDDPYNPFIKDEMSRRLMDQMGHITSMGGFIHFYLNGYFKGYYNPVERYTEDFFQRAYVSDSGWDIVKGTDEKENDRRELVEGDWDAWHALNDFAAGNDLSNPAHYATISTMLDIDNFIDYLIIECYGANFDWPRNNWYMARERSADPDLSRWRYYVWDMEMCYYALSDSAEEFTVESYLDNPFHLEDGWTFLRAPGTNRDTSPIAKLYQALRQNADFKAAWEARANVLLAPGGVLGTANVQAQYNDLYNEVNSVLLYQPMNTFIHDVWAVQRPGWLLYWFGQEGLMPVIPPPAP